MTRPATAMVLAAGLGTRMRPLTDAKPKPLVEVYGRALIDRVLDRLEAAGVGTAVVNIHHHADLLEKHLTARNGLRIAISDERTELLDSGGGAALFDLVGNVDDLLAALRVEGQIRGVELHPQRVVGLRRGAWTRRIFYETTFLAMP